MLKQRLIELLAQAAKQAQAAGTIPSVAMPEIGIEHPQKEQFGDYASSLPLKLARATGNNPLNIAKEIAALIPPTPEIESVSVAPPGFINFKLKSSWLAQQVDLILKEGENYARLDIGRGERVQIEFVSANPTGPLHVGHGRGAVLGSTLANVLDFVGYKVEKEYYINDAGNQINAFYRSLWARYQQALNKEAEVPADGYHGGYMVELAKEIVAEKNDAFLRMAEAEAVCALGKVGLLKMLAQIKDDLEKIGVSFDEWFGEQSLYDGGLFDKVMKLLREKGDLAEKEGATWFVATAQGEDKDNVVLRSDGTPTYFASDIAYHYNKFIERKFDKVIDIWGADHQGHVPRMKAVIAALGISPAERFQVIISQMVTLRRGKEVVRLSKRTGDIITLREVVDEVRAEACRFFFLARTADAQMDFDLELAKKESPENPVYYIQYAHARIASIFRLAQERNIDYSDGDVSQLTTESELALIRRMLLLPEMIEVVADTHEPHHLAYYAQELATVFHAFYKQCRVVTPDECMTRARLKLVKAAKLVLAQTLVLMGMSAPEKM